MSKETSKYVRKKKKNVKDAKRLIMPRLIMPQYLDVEVLIGIKLLVYEALSY